MKNAKTELYEIPTKNGVAKWNKDIKPRLSSGVVGEKTVIIYFTVEQLAAFQKTHKEAVTRRTLRHAVITELKLPSDVKKEEVTPDTTTDNRKSSDFIKVFDRELKKMEKTTNTKATTEQLITAIENENNKFSATQQKELKKFYNLVAEQKPSIDFGFVSQPSL